MRALNFFTSEKLPGSCRRAAAKAYRKLSLFVLESCTLSTKMRTYKQSAFELTPVQRTIVSSNFFLMKKLRGNLHRLLEPSRNVQMVPIFQIRNQIFGTQNSVLYFLEKITKTNGKIDRLGLGWGRGTGEMGEKEKEYKGVLNVNKGNFF